MEDIERLRAHGLFDAIVPRYTSYPPATHFEGSVGQRSHLEWIKKVPQNTDISLYIHIPYCKNLCWFCACRTQAIKTIRPVKTYVDHLLREIEMIRQHLPSPIRMARLHIGGGTPTILPPQTMSKLLTHVFDAFAPSDDFEFSAEIDPTDAPDDILATLVQHGLNRACLGVQDVTPAVQEAIGRHQTLKQTQDVVTFLRAAGVSALNLDLLYGLPHQTADSFAQTLSHALDMKPDRLAVYGYAHVPWMSKRQVMIRPEDLPDSAARFACASRAKDILSTQGYQRIGIDHFALPTDALAIAQQNSTVRRDFRGYTDDTCETLIGIGASAISKFRGGYVQNAVSTSAYQDRIAQNQLAGHKGYILTQQDVLMAQIVEALLCGFTFPTTSLTAAFPNNRIMIHRIGAMLVQCFPDVFVICAEGLRMTDWAKPLVRIVAHAVDEFIATNACHAAIS